MEKSSSLGMPMSPQEIFNRYKRQILRLPKASPLHQLNTKSYFTMLYFYCFICYVLFLERLRFLFCFLFSFLICFVLSNKWLDPIIFVLEKTRSVLIA